MQNVFHFILKYILLAGTLALSYFEPIRFLLVIVFVLFVFDFITGVAKSVQVRGELRLSSFRLRWWFIKTLIYLFVIALTFFVGKQMQVEQEHVITVAKFEVWFVVYIEGLSIIENLLAVREGDKFLKFLHYLLSIKFLEYVPVISDFIKNSNKKEEE